MHEAHVDGNVAERKPAAHALMAILRADGHRIVNSALHDNNQQIIKTSCGLRNQNGKLRQNYCFTIHRSS
jgi:hypothetical protein